MFQTIQNKCNEQSEWSHRLYEQSEYSYQLYEQSVYIFFIPEIEQLIFDYLDPFIDYQQLVQVNRFYHEMFTNHPVLIELRKFNKGKSIRLNKIEIIID